MATSRTAGPCANANESKRETRERGRMGKEEEGERRKRVRGTVRESESEREGEGKGWNEEGKGKGEGEKERERGEEKTETEKRGRRNAFVDGTMTPNMSVKGSGFSLYEKRGKEDISPYTSGQPYRTGDSGKAPRGKWCRLPQGSFRNLFGSYHETLCIANFPNLWHPSTRGTRSAEY